MALATCAWCCGAGAASRRRLTCEFVAEVGWTDPKSGACAPLQPSGSLNATVPINLLGRYAFPTTASATNLRPLRDPISDGTGA